jgi:uncharacterized protein YndB with AHSA1/START domain
MLKNLVFAGVCVFAAGTAGAAVVEATPNGFSIEEKTHIAESPDRVYAALVEPAKWWNSEHTFSGSAANLSLEAHAGGCLCEKLGNGGSVQHLTVIYAAPGTALRLRGALGPFQGQAVEGVLTFKLSAKDGGTDLILENNGGGFMKGGFGEWPAKVDLMLTDLVGRLKHYIESGKGDSAK